MATLNFPCLSSLSQLPDTLAHSTYTLVRVRIHIGYITRWRSLSPKTEGLRLYKSHRDLIYSHTSIETSGRQDPLSPPRRDYHTLIDHAVSSSQAAHYDDDDVCVCVRVCERGRENISNQLTLSACMHTN